MSRPKHHTIHLTTAMRLAVAREQLVILNDGRDRYMPASAFVQQYADAAAQIEEQEARQ